MLTSADFDKSLPVFILKMRRYIVHHGAVGAARTFGRVGVPVYAITEDHYTPLAASRYVVGAFQWTDSLSDPSSILEDMHRMSRRIGRPALLMATDDVAAIFLARNRLQLSPAFVTPNIEADLVRDLCNKRELYGLCRRAGIPCPNTSFPRSIDDVRAFIETAVFPVMVKAAESHRLPLNAASAAIANSPKELLDIYRAAESPDNPNLLLQEYIPRGSEDWVFHGYRNPETDVMVSFTGQKLRSWPPFAGPTTLGICRENEVLKRQTEKLLREINYAGVMDLDYRLDNRDGQYKLLDFNPRIGANFRMFLDQAGLDVLRAMHLDLSGRSVRRVAAQSGRKLMVESYDYFASFGYIRKGALTWRGWRQSLQGRPERAWLQKDDLMPFFVMWLRLIGQTIFSRLSRLHRRSRLRRDERSVSPEVRPASFRLPLEAVTPVLENHNTDRTHSRA